MIAQPMHIALGFQSGYDSKHGVRVPEDVGKFIKDTLGGATLQQLLTPGPLDDGHNGDRRLLGSAGGDIVLEIKNAVPSTVTVPSQAPTPSGGSQSPNLAAPFVSSSRAKSAFDVLKGSFGGDTKASQHASKKGSSPNLSERPGDMDDFDSNIRLIPAVEEEGRFAQSIDAVAKSNQHNNCQSFSTY
jgi:hypothetical protein